MLSKYIFADKKISREFWNKFFNFQFSSFPGSLYFSNRQVSILYEEVGIETQLMQKLGRYSNVRICICWSISKENTPWKQEEMIHSSGELTRWIDCDSLHIQANERLKTYRIEGKFEYSSVLYASEWLNFSISESTSIRYTSTVFHSDVITFGVGFSFEPTTAEIQILTYVHIS